MNRTVTIDSLQFELSSMHGHEHRIESIVRRAAELLAERLGERWPDDGAGSPVRSIPHIAVTARSVDLRMLTTEEAAHELSTTLADAILRRLQ